MLCVAVWIFFGSLGFVWHCPFIRQECDVNRCIPLVIHGDSADSHRRRSFQLVTIGSLVVSGNFFDTKLLCYCLDEFRASSSTATTLDAWVAWSICELQCGFFLDVDPWGREYPPHNEGRKGAICGNYRAVLVVHKGDEKYIQKVYHTSHTPVSRHVCVHCRAENQPGPMVYTTHGPSAEHRRTMLTTAEFIQDVCGVKTFVNIPGWSVEMLHGDWLHVVDLSLVPECAASCLVELVQQGCWGGNGRTADERLQKAYSCFITACRQSRVRSRGVMFSMPLGCL